MTTIFDHRREVRRQIAIMRVDHEPQQSGLVDPRTGNPPSTWERVEQLLLGRYLHQESLKPSDGIASWRRATI